MKRLTRDEKLMNRTAAAVCALLFALFSLSYLIFMQGDLMATVQDLLSDGKTTAHPPVQALLITLLLFVVHLLYNRVVRMRCYWAACAYLPSSLLLAFVTDIDRTLFYNWHTPWRWLWIMGAGAMLCYATYALSRKLLVPAIKKYSSDVYRVLWVNLLLMALQFVGVGLLANSDEQLHYELRVARLIKEEKPQQALSVGLNAHKATRELTRLRGMALAQSGALGDRLFAYPQPYGAQGLMPSRLSVRTTLLCDSDYVRHFGAEPMYNESPVAFFGRALRRSGDSVAYLRDYYLSALLLERDLARFAAELPRLYPPGDTLPLHYRQALRLCGKSAATEQIEEDYQRFDSLSNLPYGSERERANQMRSTYGRTYWWYHRFGEK